MAEESTSTQDIAKVYTATRRFPQLIGRTSDGSRIWGGPYTYTQIFGGGAALFVLWKSMALWSIGGGLMDWAVVLTLTAGVVVGLGKLPLGGRNPLSMLQGVGNAVAATAPREVGGVTIRPRKPQAVYSPVRILTALSPEPAAEPARADTAVAAVSTADPVPVAASSTPESRPRRRPAPAAVPAPQREPADVERETVPAPPRLVALEGEGRDSSPPRPRVAAAQTSVQSLLTMAQQRKEA
ncbi:hypothetical protein G6031_02795 [Dietzia sp. CQ4]|uniref:hypothetical protein n=1 Tax=Dietzia sp. (strain CQ4) TaxID=370437 RepID=UPI0015FBEE87|nr:hypothetical protein [Dietzia sp. CQ4]MBB1033316.1 hypothetical protein [Dietzia sp. CQ4]